MMASPPSWVVHLRFGNLKLRDSQARLEAAWSHVEGMLPERQLINVHANTVEGVKG